MKTIAILYGGKSGEHEVSLISAASIVQNLDPEKYAILPIGITKNGEWLLQDLPGLKASLKNRGHMEGLPAIKAGERVLVLPGQGLAVEAVSGGWRKLDCDIVFPVLHGTFGEDGTVQGLLECAGLPYVGSGVLGSAAGMDKQVAKELWLREGIPVVEFITVRKSDWKNPAFLPALGRKIEARFGWPCFVKPACSGSSVGTSKASDQTSLEKALDRAFLYDEKVLVEEFIPARELECAVLGNDNPKAFSPGEIIPAHEYYDYSAKYKDPQGALFQIPASLSEAQEQALKATAIKAYKACGFSGMARMDFFMDKRTGAILLNEANTIPGFTAISMYPRMCQAGGLSYPALLEALLDLAMERFESRNRLSFSYETEA